MSVFIRRFYSDVSTKIFQEVSLQNLPVVFCIDRAGLVGSDGPNSSRPDGYWFYADDAEYDFDFAGEWN
jgi:deoxyxylulose-5-phosphate synthase